MSLRLKYRAKWTLRQRYSQGAIYRNLRNLLKEEESAFHLVFYLMNAFASEESDDNECWTEAEYAVQVTLDEFDLYYSGKQEHYSENGEDTDMAIATQHIASVDKPSSKAKDNEYFLDGNVVSLSYVAKKNWWGHLQTMWTANQLWLIRQGIASKCNFHLNSMLISMLHAQSLVSLSCQTCSSTLAVST